AGPRRVRRARPRLVRRRARGLGPAVRARASRRALPPQPGRRPRRGRRLLAEAARVPPSLLREAPARDRAALDAVRGVRALAGVAHGRLPRSALALPRLLGGGAGRGLHARGVEAPLLPPAEPAGAGAGDGAGGLAARGRARATALCPRPGRAGDRRGGPDRARVRCTLAPALAVRSQHARRAVAHRAGRAVSS